MRVFSKVFVIASLCLSFAATAFSQETLWEILNEKATSLYEQGQYEEAVKFAKEALKVAEETFGSEHPECGDLPEQSGGTLFILRASMPRLSLFTRGHWQYAEKALGKDHPDVALPEQSGGTL